MRKCEDAKVAKRPFSHLRTFSYSHYSDDRLFRKANGIYYTPDYIIDFILSRTLDIQLKGKEPGQISNFRILDPACGSGLFLLAALKRLFDWHERWGLRLTEDEKVEILLANIFGVDIDNTAVEETKVSLLRSISPCSSLSSLSSVDLSNNIRTGNSVIGLQSIIGGEFDLIIGNPPYGAKMSSDDRDQISKRFRTGTSDTAAIMMLQSYRSTRDGGMNGLIVPKPFVYSSNWGKIRLEIIDELKELTDVGKAWAEVKLEQVIYILEKGRKTQGYRTYKRAEERFVPAGQVDKGECRRFGFIINGVNDLEMSIGRKINRIGSPLGDLVTNRRGAMLQRKLNEKGSGKRAIGGKQIRRYFIEGEKGFLEETEENGVVRPGSILVQNIIAHVKKPAGHIKIYGAVADDETAEQMLILDTVNQLINNSQMSSYYLLGLLHSKLINWYVYRFIFAKAIRTMHFDSPVTDRVPIRLIDFSNPGDKALHDEIAGIAKEISSQKRNGDYVANGELEEKLERLVFGLYELTQKEIKSVYY